MTERLKYILIAFIVAVLFIPLLQYKLEIFEVKPLEGDVTIAKKPEFSKEHYWDLSWQEAYNRYINDNFGFRSSFVRLINQVRFSTFHTTRAPGVVIGKKDELFIESYIDDYIGRNYLGASRIKENVGKIKRVQDSLKSRDIDLIVVFAPGKASYYPELIPDAYLRKKKDSTNYKSYSQQFAEAGVNFIDLNKWFAEKKPSFKYPVYPKSGTHWNHYAMCLAIDSINKYIEKKRNITLTDFDFHLVNYDTDLKGNDYDIGILMNLVKPIEKDPNPYPVYRFKEKRGDVKPDVLVVGDSYWWCLVGDDLPIHFYREDEYWFYNRDQYIRNGKRGAVKDLNLSAALAQRQVVILMATEATFYMFPYGFADDAYKLYCEDHSAQLAEITKGIKETGEWYNAVVNKANENHVPVDKQIRLDAEYILADQLFHKKEETLESAMENIKNNPEWMADIKRKAAENKISPEEQLKRDAQWVLDNQKK